MAVMRRRCLLFLCGEPIARKKKVSWRITKGPSHAEALDPIHSTQVLGLLAGTSLCHLRARGRA